MVWSDEANGSGFIDTSKWFHQPLLPNGSSWFNEQQHYTDRLANLTKNFWFLTIVARKENLTDQGLKNYTSARLNSKFTFTYGRVEAMANYLKEMELAQI